MNDINFDALERKAAAYAASGLFGKMSKDEAFGRLILAHDLELGDVSAMRDIYRIEEADGIGIRGPAFAAKVASHPNYELQIMESSGELCTLKLMRRSTGQSWTHTLTIEQVRREGVGDSAAWEATPDTNLYYRLLSKMVRWHAGDIWNHNTVYTTGDFVEGTAYVQEKPINIDDLPIPEPDTISLEELDEPEETTEEIIETEDNTMAAEPETKTVSAKDAPF